MYLSDFIKVLNPHYANTYH